VVSVIICKKCGKPLAELDRGRYYAHICSDCCEKYGLCQDCGTPVILTPEQVKSGFACSGWHTVKYLESVLKEVTIHELPSPHEEGDVTITKREVECPKCGHRFEVSRY